MSTISATVFNTTRVLANGVRQKKSMRSGRMDKEKKIKLSSICRWYNMIAYLKNSRKINDQI